MLIGESIRKHTTAQSVYQAIVLKQALHEIELDNIGFVKNLTPFAYEELTPGAQVDLKDAVRDSGVGEETKHQSACGQLNPLQAPTLKRQ
ncbi:hypothetical protein EB796_017214 [Bugula neritina]|uniref:Uncharacterized protein n=1 Tax=Bugula neritina TaxID=10212 RepID=A0A7J7JFT3_BUGNE|nr:hypothetical protein EB796_017214 [Bugula neritina]